ncbi:dihydrofolate reductase family protein [Dactylosporangium sp. CA-233914]|uniref:dihydrofolate reductase family protein n=1 Tax=Dactylosporangium sp. CA-233914 TaxID=3239934 RepID=UPI003D8A7998
MAELVADLFVSADGFAAGEDVGAFFGYDGPDLQAWIAEEAARPQHLLMGRVTYEALPMPGPRIVYSNTLTEAEPGVRILGGDLAGSVARLKHDSDVMIRTIGSLRLVGGLLRAGLVDRLRLMVFPITLGADGREPAYAGYPRSGYDLVGSKVLDARIVLLDYRPAK